MSWVTWILIGLVAGALAKRLTPGEANEPKGCALTILLGIGGSVLVGFLMQNILRMEGNGGFIATTFGATIGAVILLYLFRVFWK